MEILLPGRASDQRSPEAKLDLGELAALVDVEVVAAKSIEVRARAPETSGVIADVVESDLDVQQLADVIELRWSDDLVEYVSADELCERHGTSARAGATVVRLPGFRKSPTRGLGELVLEGIRHLRVKLNDWLLGQTIQEAVGLLVVALEEKLVPEPGLFRLDASGALRSAGALSSADDPWLVLLHGTASTTTASFADLLGNGFERWLASYGEGRLLALEHRTLSVSPIDNALDLVGALPARARLHLLGYSRGGLVGEISCHAGGLEKERALFFGDDATTREKLAELSQRMADKKIVVERFARVGSPVAGTLLAGERFESYLNVALNLMGMLGLDGPAYRFLKALLLAVVATRSRADILPGLEAMRPESKLVAMLNSSSPRAGGELAAIAGDCEGGGMFDRLRALCADLYFREANDFVVDTRSMTRGLPRLAAKGWVHRAAHVSHFSYFRNPETRDRIEAWLLRGDATRLETLADADASRERFLHLLAEVPRAPGPPDPKQDRPVVFLVPGIMGSHLALAGERVWLSAARLLMGGLGELPIEREAEPDGLVKLAYARIYRHLQKTHTVRPFPFDWRRSIEEAASELARAVAAELDAHDQPVRILAHSMGGLVGRGLKAFHPEIWSRACARGGRLVMLGTPNRGAAVVVNIFLGRERLVHMLAALDQCHNLGELSALVRAFPGLLEMLPRDGSADFLDETCWREAGDDRPDPAALREAEKLRDALDERGVDASHMIYVAGLATETPAARLEGGAIVIDEITDGDGRVPWTLGRLDGVPTYYIDAVHGEMANDEPSFAGFRELLDTGSTRLLSRAPMVELRAAVRQPFGASRAAELRIYPKAEDVEREALGIAVERTESARSLHVSVAHGDLRESSHPVMVGHYLGDDIVSAEWVLDQQLGGKLSIDRALGLYPGYGGTSRVFRGTPGALVVGLGRVGELTRLALLETVTSGMLNLARASLEEAREGGEEAGPLLVGVSSLLIGSFGGAKVALEDSIGAIVQAALDANGALAVQGQWDAVRIHTLQFVELFHDVAVRAAHIVRRLAESEVSLERGDRIALTPKLQILPGGRRQRPRSPYESGWARRVRISVESDKLVYDVVTDLARTEPMEQAVQWDMVRSLLERAPEASDPSVPGILARYLVPRMLAVGARLGADLVLELDKRAAQIPWELFELGDSGDEPIGARIGVVRQLSVSTSSRTPAERARNRSALVIGEPRSSYPELPGARREAERVRDRLRARGFDVVAKIQCSREEILRALYERPDGYDILHIAGHGHRDDKPVCTGVVLDEGYLTSIELERIPRAPSVVFLNCCHLGSVDGATTTRHPGELAASLAEALIGAGVQVVAAAGWAVDDEAAASFAETFYDGLLDGRSLVSVARDARNHAYQVAPRSTTWGAYHVYGDPGFVLDSVTAQGDADHSAERDPFVACEELIEVLADLAVSAGSTRDERAAASLAERLEQLAADCPDEWRGGPVLAAFGDVWRKLNRPEQAIAAYSQALASSAITLATVEHLAHVERNLAQMLLARDGAAARRLLESAIGRLDALVAIAPSVERLTLLGSAFKTRALLELDGARSEALTKAADAYRQASALAPNGLDYYPALNAAACGVMLGWCDVDVRALIADAERDARERERLRPDVWNRIALADAALVRMLCDASDGAPVIEAYRGAFSLGMGADLSHRDSVRDHLEFLGVVCPPGDKLRALELVTRELFPYTSEQT